MERGSTAEVFDESTPVSSRRSSGSHLSRMIASTRRSLFSSSHREHRSRSSGSRSSPPDGQVATEAAPSPTEAAPSPIVSVRSGLVTDDGDGDLERRVSADRRSQMTLEMDLVDGEPSPDEDCPICLMPLTECVVTPCKHKFHQECLERCVLSAPATSPSAFFPMRKARCPLCRGALHAAMPVEASSASGRAIDVIAVPPEGAMCHYDRRYAFTSLGGFAAPGMLYVMTSNDDRYTPSESVMWTLTLRTAATVHLNFRSEKHVRNGGCESWLRSGGWQLNREIESAVSTGYPNGPYTGPVFSKACAAGTVELHGSNYWEGTYFAFVDVGSQQSTAWAPRYGSPSRVALPPGLLTALLPLGPLTTLAPPMSAAASAALASSSDEEEVEADTGWDEEDAAGWDAMAGGR